MKKEALTERQLVARIDAQLRRCHGWDGDKIEADRKSALDYYFQRPRGDEVTGASKVVSGDVSSMVEANLASMMDAFSGDEIAEFHAYGEADEDQAALESCAVQYMVMARNNGYLQFLQAIKDALLLRNGIIKVWVEDKVSVTRRKYLDVEPEVIPELIDSVPPNVDLELGEYDPEKKTLNAKFTTHDRRFRCEAIPIENFLYVAEWDSPSLREIPFCAERHISPRSDLIEMGFDKTKVNGLRPWTTNLKIAGTARNPRNVTDFREAVDKSQDLIEWFECFVLMDSGDGTSERHSIAISNMTLLSDEPATIVPFAAGAAIINPHRFLGISLYDKLRQVQDVSTGLERGLLDNVTASNKPRVAYLDGLVNVEDLDNGRPNGSVRVRKSVGEVGRAVSAIIIPDMSQGILANLEHQRSLRSELGGAALDMQSAPMQVGGSQGRVGSQGIEKAYSVMEQLAALMTRTVAATLIREVFLIAHAMLREHFDEPLPFKQGARWRTAIPSEWQAREELTVKVGMSPGERTRRTMALERIGKFQTDMAAQGMDEVLVDLERFYRLAMDWCRSQDIPNPEQYFVDPRSEQSMKARKIKGDAAERENAAQQAFLQQAVQLEQLRTAFDKYKQDTDLQFKYFAETLKAEIEEAKIVGSATADIIKTGLTPKGGMNGESIGLNGSGGNSAGGKKPSGKSVASRTVGKSAK